MDEGFEMDEGLVNAGPGRSVSTDPADGYLLRCIKVCFVGCIDGYLDGWVNNGWWMSG